MKPVRMDPSAGQNWSCHSCGECCRNHLLITVSPEEKQRIEQQNWTAADGVNPSGLIVSGLGRHRLGHQADGSCVFLDSSARCRIHSKFGEAAKPLACRLYPLVIHPAGNEWKVGLRFSCPSATDNRGRPLAEQGAALQKLAKEVLPEGWKQSPPPPVAEASGLGWPDFLRFTRWLDHTLAAPEIPVSLKLVQALDWLNRIERGCLDQIAGEGAEEILDALVTSAAEKTLGLPADIEKPSPIGRLFLRLLVLEHARSVTVADQDVRSASRWKTLAAAFRLAHSRGRTPDLRAGLKRVEFADIEKPFGPIPPGAEALLTRYFRVKVQSLHFCGRAFHGRPLIEGFRNLALLYPVILWLARWLAVSDGRSALSESDVVRAVRLADHSYSYSPYMSWRTRLIHQRNDIVRLCLWYAQ